MENASFIDLSVGSESDKNQVFIASHQIRIHNSKFTDFYLCARSNPIIENCENLGFGNMMETDFGKNEETLNLILEASLDTRNLWDQVHDFNWLK